MANIDPLERERIQREAMGAPPAPTSQVYELKRDQRRPEDEKTFKIVAGGSVIEALCGAAGVILAILVLAGVLPQYTAAVAVILIGVGLISQGSAVAARYKHLLREAGGGRSHEAEFGGGITAEFVGGIAGIALGVLALIGMVPLVLLSAAIITFGGALLVGSALGMGVSSIGGEYDRWADATRDATRVASGMQLLVGLGTVVLGILALLALPDRATAMLLVGVGLLASSSAVLLVGTAVGGRMAALLRK